VVLNCDSDGGTCSWGGDSGFFMCMNVEAPETNPDGDLFRGGIGR